MDSLLIEETLRRVADYVAALQQVQREHQIEGPCPAPSDLGFSRIAARAAAAEDGNVAVLNDLSLRFRATSEAMAHHHSRIEWTHVHDRVQWGYVSMFVRTFSLAFNEAVGARASDGGAAGRLQLSDDVVRHIAASVDSEGLARLAHGLERAIAVAPSIAQEALLDERVERFAATPWPIVDGALCSG